MSFLDFFENKSNPKIVISTEEYKSQLWNAIKELLEFSQADEARLQNFKLNVSDIEKQLYQVGYEQFDNAAIILSSKNLDKINALVENLMEYQRQLKDDYEKIAVVRRIIKSIWDYEAQLGGYKKYTEEDAMKQRGNILKTTLDNMKVIASNIRHAIDKIQWNGTPLDISPSEDFSYESNWMEGTDSAVVNFGVSSDEFGTMSPQFSYFQDNGKVIIDDVLDAGDDEFFVDPKVESDYFQLVQELRNPGGKSKIMTVYTARPQKDREIYQNAKQVPSNIFVTSSANRAAGIAVDFGSKEPRDVWKIRIDSKYLLNTLDTGTVRDYQVVGSGLIPIKSISLN